MSDRLRGISVYESIKPSDQPQYDLVSGRAPEVFKWLDRLPNYEVMADQATRDAWLESVSELKREFPNHLRAGIVDGRRRLFYVFPSDAEDEDFDFLLALIEQTKKQWARNRKPTDDRPTHEALRPGAERSEAECPSKNANDKLSEEPNTEEV